MVTVTVEQTFSKEWKKLEAASPKGFKVVVALSGGVDSRVLLHLIHQVLPSSRLVVAHFDHQIRPSSQQVALEVKRFCLGIGIEQVFLGNRKGGKCSEEALRKERYQFLEEVRKKTKSNFILLAHHANDQLETFLMRLLRGSGVYGLASMSKKQGVLVRPLLGISKSDIEAFAQKASLSFHEDETNQQRKYFRNQIRHELVPEFIKVSFRYGGEQQLLKRMESLTEELQVIRRENKKKARRWINTQVRESFYWSSFPRKSWLKLKSQEKKMVALFLWKECVNEPLETKEIKLLNQSIQKQKRLFLSGGVEVIPSCGNVYLQTPGQKKKQVHFRNSALLIDTCCIPGKKRKLQALLKKEGVELRFLKPGDRYQNKKMKRRCLDDLIPAPERSLLPVLAQKNSKELAWYFPLPHAILECLQVPWASWRPDIQQNK
ncbi:MAG: tRNA lysidine(34) synthetase TilS [Pseudomonadota bacterium]